MIQLNILDPAAENSPLRIYRRAMQKWCSHVADEVALGEAGIYANASLSSVPEANCVLGNLEVDAEEKVLAHFAQAGTRPRAWYLAGGQAQLSNLRKRHFELWRLDSEAGDLFQGHADLTIIPARASLPHARQIAAFIRPDADPQEAGEAAMCHLDDPHLDAILALYEGRAVGYASVLSTGEAGYVSELFVRQEHRGRGYGSALAGRILDICARSLFKQVVCGIEAGDEAAARFCQRVGFVPGEVVELWV